MNRILRYGVCLMLSIAPLLCLAQNDSMNAKGITPITADSLASGNYKDVFTSFFQLAFNDLTGPQKEVAFSSNPFAIMAKADPSLLVDTNYVKYTHLRNFNFNVNLGVDSTYHLNGFSFGFKYAIINARDVTVSKYFITRAVNQQGEFQKFNDAINQKVAELLTTDRALAKKVNALMHAWRTDSTVQFNTLDTSVQAIVLGVIKDNNLNTLASLLKQYPSLNFYTESQKSYQELKNEWQSKPLWTVAASSTFKPNTYSSTNALAANSINLSSEFLKGLNPKDAVSTELDLLAMDNILADSTSSKQNLNRNIFSFQPGINFTIKSTKTDRSILELKVSGTYYHIFSNPYPSEKTDSSTINGELRIRVINDLWVPVTIKYDPVNHNVFGFLNVKMNFTALAGLFKS